MTFFSVVASSFEMGGRISVHEVVDLSFSAGPPEMWSRMRVGIDNHFNDIGNSTQNINQKNRLLHPESESSVCDSLQAAILLPL